MGGCGWLWLVVVGCGWLSVLTSVFAQPLVFPTLRILHGGQLRRGDDGFVGPCFSNSFDKGFSPLGFTFAAFKGGLFAAATRILAQKQSENKTHKDAEAYDGVDGR